MAWPTLTPADFVGEFADNYREGVERGVTHCCNVPVYVLTTCGGRRVVFNAWGEWLPACPKCGAQLEVREAEAVTA